VLIERPIKVGDYVQAGDTMGEVTDISLRATTIVTPQNTAVIVPNSEFISSRVINLSFRDSIVRLTIPVSIDRDEDPEKLIGLLSGIAEKEPGILKDRPIQVLLDSFGKETQKFKLVVWTQTYARQPEVLQSELNRAISKALISQNVKTAVEPAKIEQTESMASPRPADTAMAAR
jgi:small-conductance mechanosensitive channel